jgi:hypothetical protein
MKSKVLFIWIEGADDRRFFEAIIKPKLKSKYIDIRLIEYSRKKSTFTENFIRTIESMGADYIYVTDIDRSPCITAKKERVKKEINNIDIGKIVIVIKEIESWYFAGLTAKALQSLGIEDYHKFATTNELQKEAFNKNIPKKFNSRIDFMQEVLKLFQLETVTNNQTNYSLCYFIQKYLEKPT